MNRIAMTAIAAAVAVTTTYVKAMVPEQVKIDSGTVAGAISGQPTVRACMTPVEQGMDVKHLNAWPSLRRDFLHLVGRLTPSFGMQVGFYYKTFIRPRRLWPFYEKILRNAAGLGRLDEEHRRTERYEKVHRHVDVLVLGAEPFLNGAASALRHIDEAGLQNVRLYPGDARDLLSVLPDRSLERIFVLFPDPWPKNPHAKRRLFNEHNLDLFLNLLTPTGKLHVRTDVEPYFRELNRLVAQTARFKEFPLDEEMLAPAPDRDDALVEQSFLGDRRVASHRDDALAGETLRFLAQDGDRRTFRHRSLANLEEAHLDDRRSAHADAHEDALADPCQRRRARLEARRAAEVDVAGIDRLAADETRHHRRRRGADRVVDDVDAIAAVGLEDVARLEARHRRTRDELKVGAARQHARAEPAAAAAAAGDRDQPAQPAGNGADLDRRADLDLEIGKALEQRRSERIGGRRTGRFAHAASVARAAAASAVPQRTRPEHARTATPTPTLATPRPAMTYEYGSDSKLLELPNPYQLQNRLLWLCGLVVGKGNLLPGYAANKKFVLTKWPQIEREFPKHFRLATVMMKGPAFVKDIAEQAGVGEAEAIDFVNAGIVTGHIVIEGTTTATGDVPKATGLPLASTCLPLLSISSCCR